MLLGDRLRAIRESKHMSQGDIEKRTGLLRCYLSRVECGHTVPSVETLEKLARALEVPLYELFYEGEGRPNSPKLTGLSGAHDLDWGNSGTEVSQFRKLLLDLSEMTDSKRALLLSFAGKVVSSKRRANLKARKPS
jgi:transcriptional regulator with XRE-family HTH domain